MTSSEARDDLKAQIEAAKKKLAEKAKGAHTGIYKAVTTSCLLVEAEVNRLMTETDVNGAISYGKRKHHPSMPGSAPAVDYGIVRRSVTHTVEEVGSRIVGRVGSTLKDPPIMAYLEDGTSRMAPRPSLGPAIDNKREQIKQLLSDGAQGRDVSIGLEGSTAGVGVDASD
jgi:hypothetical protein